MIDINVMITFFIITTITSTLIITIMIIITICYHHIPNKIHIPVYQSWSLSLILLSSSLINIIIIHNNRPHINNKIDIPVPPIVSICKQLTINSFHRFFLRFQFPSFLFQWCSIVFQYFQLIRRNGYSLW